MENANDKDAALYLAVKHDMPSLLETMQTGPDPIA